MELVGYLAAIRQSLPYRLGVRAVAIARYNVYFPMPAQPLFQIVPVAAVQYRYRLVRIQIKYRRVIPFSFPGREIVRADPFHVRIVLDSYARYQLIYRIVANPDAHSL
jgi:hypothetical protein